MKKPRISVPANQTRLVFASLSAILLGVVLTTPARATVVFTDYGPSVCGGSSLCLGANGINGAEVVGGTAQTYQPTDSLDTESLAGAFVPTGNFTFNDVSLPLITVGDGDADVYLMSSSGAAPGSVLESWLNVVGTTQQVYPIAQTTITLDASGPAVTLTSGDEYWLVVTAASTTSAVEWDLGWAASIGPGALYDPINAGNSGPWFTNEAESAFEIDGTAISSGPPPPTIPEPSMFWLLGIGFVGVAIVRRRMKSASTRTAAD